VHRTAKKWIKIYDTCAQLLFYSLNLLFSGILVAIAAMVCLSSLLPEGGYGPGKLTTKGEKWFTKDIVFYSIIWLGLQVGKINQILHCDWLSKQTGWGNFAYLPLTVVSSKKKVLSQEGWILGTVAVFSFYVFMALDCVLVHKHSQKWKKLSKLY